MKILIGVVFLGHLFASGLMAQEAKQIIILGTKKSKQTIEFNADEVRNLLDDKAKGNLMLLNSTFEKKGLTCCSPSKKLSKCIWSCCDGATINTCTTSERLQEVVDLYFTSLSDTTRKTKPDENH
jgi:hypothetical protein